MPREDKTEKNGKQKSAEETRMQQASSPSSSQASATNGKGASQADVSRSVAALKQGGAGAGAPKPTVSHMLGELTWLMSQSPMHKHFSIGDLEWIVMPAILLEQFRVFHGEQSPVGFALWANLSEAAEERLNAAAMAGAGARLRPDEWNSGDRLWLVELCAPFATEENKLTEAMVADLMQNVFPGRTFKMHVTDPLTGKRDVKEIEV